VDWYLISAARLMFVSSGAVSAGKPIGQLYDGTVIPLIAGFALTELAALVITEWAEQGRVAHPITPS